MEEGSGNVFEMRMAFGWDFCCSGGEILLLRLWLMMNRCRYCWSVPMIDE